MDHCRVIPLPLADRSVLQGDQTDLAVERLLGPQRECGALANLDRAARAFAVALSGLGAWLGAQLHAALHHRTRSIVAALVDHRVAAKLWDSRWQFSVAGAS